MRLREPIVLAWVQLADTLIAERAITTREQVRFHVRYTTDLKLRMCLATPIVKVPMQPNV
eukprot:3503634-Amphidinium_carterae.1